MEIRINKEIRNYTEAVFFGLSLRQCVFSGLACGVAAGVFFVLRPYVGMETLSWICILAAAPFAVMGFIKYNGMPAEQFIRAWYRSRFCTPKRLVFKSENLYYEVLKDMLEEQESLQIKSQDQSDLDRRKIYRRQIGRKARQKGHREYAGLQCQDIRLSVSPVQAGGIHVHRRQIIQRGEIVPHLSVVASQKFVSSGRHINIERLPLGSLTVQEVVHRLLGR